MLALPFVAMQAETLVLGLWDAWHHAHFEDDFAWVGLRLRLDGAVDIVSTCKSQQPFRDA